MSVSHRVLRSHKMPVQVTRGHVVLCNERLLDGDNFVETNVRVELGLDVAEGDDRTVGAVTTIGRSGFNHECRGMEIYPNFPFASRAGEMATASWNVLRNALSLI